MQLKANKTKMYEFARRRYPDLPSIRFTDCYRHSRAKDCALDFWIRDTYYPMWLSLEPDETALLRETYTPRDTGESRQRTEPVSLDELRELGMLED